MSERAVYVVEEGQGVDEGCVREFWVSNGPEYRHTLSFEPTEDGVEIKWHTDTPASEQDIEVERVLEVSLTDAKRMLSAMERAINNYGRC